MTAARILEVALRNVNLALDVPDGTRWHAAYTNRAIGALDTSSAQEVRDYGVDYGVRVYQSKDFLCRGDRESIRQAARLLQEAQQCVAGH